MLVWGISSHHRLPLWELPSYQKLLDVARIGGAPKQHRGAYESGTPEAAAGAVRILAETRVVFHFVKYAHSKTGLSHRQCELAIEIAADRVHRVPPRTEVRLAHGEAVAVLPRLGNRRTHVCVLVFGRTLMVGRGDVK